MATIHFEKKGQGDTIVLIHGFCETHEVWESFAEKLSTNFQVLLPDLPGFGMSSLLPTPFSIATVAMEMHRWMDDLQLVRPIIIGHSLGGYVALAMAQQQPERVSGFGLFHSTAYSDSPERKENRNKVIEFVKSHGAAPFIDTFVPSLFYQATSPHFSTMYRIASATRAETIMAYAAAMRDRPSYEHLLQTFRRPILMIAGEKDPIIPYEQSSAQAGLMKFPFFCGLKDAGHMGMFESEPASIKFVKDFANLALEFKS